MSLRSVSLAPRRPAPSLVPRRDRLWFVVMVVGLAAIPLYLLLPSQLAQQWVYTLWGTGSALGIVGGVALHRPERAKAWLTIAFGLALVTGGDLLWAWFKTATGEIPFPSTADGAYLGGYVVIAIGLLALFRGRVPGGDRAGLIDATILTTGFGFLSWVFLMHPYLHDASLSPIESSIATAYPVVDVLLLGVTLRLLLAPGRRVVAFRLLIVGLTSFLIGDSIYAVLSLQGIYETGQLVDGIWLVGYVSLAAFGLHPSMRALTEPAASAPQRLTFKRLGLLGAASLMAPAVMVIEQLRGDPIDVPVVVAGSILLFTLVLTRLADALRDLSATLFERMALEGQLKHQAQHDHLTGLANRLLFGVRLDETLAAGTPLAVLFIDLDDFKTVNDTLGHSAGDDLLVAVAGRLSASLRPEDVAARLGGDEFAVFLPGCNNEEEARAVATRILRRITEPFAIQGRSLAISPSIGVAVRTPGATSGEEMMRDADTAMYLAKAEGKAQVAIYRKDIRDRAVALLSRREQLGHAIDHDQLVLHYQPIIDLRTNRVEGLEALVRWHHPDEGLLAPAEFIPLAEETGLIGRLGEWVLRNACTEATGWPTRDDGKPLKVSVNLSAHQLRDPSIVEVIRSVLVETALAPARLVVEVTESSFVEVDSAAERLAAVGALGVHVAIDDFGTGYSSLSYLAQLPVHAVKVDRSFTNMVGATGREGQVARLVMQLASAVDLEAIVEGIETAEQLAEVRRLGCRFGQGFFIARPMPAADVLPFLAKSESDLVASRLGADAAA